MLDGLPGREIVWEHVDSLVDRRIDSTHQHVWPFSGGMPIDVRFMLLDRADTVPKHRPDHLEVVFFESGEAAYEVEDEGFLLHENDLVVVGDQRAHRTLPARQAGSEARIAVLSFLPRLLFADQPRAEDYQYLTPFSPAASSVPSVIQGANGLSAEIFELMQKVRRELPVDTERSALAVRTYLRMILFLLTAHYWEFQETRGGMKRQQVKLERISPAIENIGHERNWALTVEQAARMCAMSPSCFMQVFRQATGQSFVSYVNQARVDHAKDLLKNSDLGLAEIGYETGFCDQSYFGSVFRRLEGVTPLVFRRTYRVSLPELG